MKPYKEAKHVVIDIETMGIETGAPIIQIAAASVLYNEKENCPIVQSEFCRFISLESNANKGLTKFDGDTLEWWLNQAERSKEAMNVLKEVAHGDRLYDVISEYLDWDYLFGTSSDDNIDTYYWSRGTDFDFRHLGNAFKLFGFQTPWKFWQLRDLRTIDDPAFVGDYTRPKDLHDARLDVDNAVHLLCWAIWRQCPAHYQK